MSRKFSRQFDMTFSKKPKEKRRRRNRRRKKRLKCVPLMAVFTVCDMLFGRKRREKIGQYVS